MASTVPAATTKPTNRRRSAECECFDSLLRTRPAAPRCLSRALVNSNLRAALARRDVISFVAICASDRRHESAIRSLKRPGFDAGWVSLPSGGALAGSFARKFAQSSALARVDPDPSGHTGRCC